MDVKKQVKQPTFCLVESLLCAGCFSLTPLDSIKYTSKSSHPVCGGCHQLGLDDCNRCGGLEPHDTGNCVTCEMLLPFELESLGKRVEWGVG